MVTLLNIHYIQGRVQLVIPKACVPASLQGSPPELTLREYLTETLLTLGGSGHPTNSHYYYRPSWYDQGPHIYAKCPIVLLAMVTQWGGQVKEG